MIREAFIGLAGEVVDLVAPHTEADPAGLLLSFLVSFGAAAGPGPHALADGAQHPSRLNVVLVGASSRARKGTSWSVIRNVMQHAAPDLIGRRLVAGLASGEGLVAELDSRDSGARNVLVVEPEIARLLRTASRSASLSALLRQAWDGEALSVLTRGKPLKVTGASVSLLGHTTAEELRRRLDATDIANGFANRMLFCWVERARKLPLGATVPENELDAIGVRIGHAITRARQLRCLTFSADGERAWTDFYNSIDDAQIGVVGALLARAEAQVLRLAITYALLDGFEAIAARHVDAAEAVWEHCGGTVHRVFGDHQPDHVVTILLAALREAGAAGLDGSQQRDLFHRHLSGSRLAAARAELDRRGVARTVLVETAGRPRIVTRLMSGDSPASSDSRTLWSLSSPSQSPVRSQAIDGPNDEFLGSDKRGVSEASDE